MIGIKNSKKVVEDPNLVQKIAHNWFTMLRNSKPNQIADAITRTEGKTQLGCKDTLFDRTFGRITFTTEFSDFGDGFDQLRLLCKGLQKPADKEKLFKHLVMQICSGTLCSTPNFYNRDLWVSFYDKRPKMREADFTRLSKKKAGLTM